MKESGLTSVPHYLNDDIRMILERCIFEVVNDFESTDMGRPHHPTTIALHDARNRVFDDLKWNEDVYDEPRAATSATETHDNRLDDMRVCGPRLDPAE